MRTKELPKPIPAPNTQAKKERKHYTENKGDYEGVYFTDLVSLKVCPTSKTQEDSYALTFLRELKGGTRNRKKHKDKEHKPCHFTSLDSVKKSNDALNSWTEPVQTFQLSLSISLCIN